MIHKIEDIYVPNHDSPKENETEEAVNVTVAVNAAILANVADVIYRRKKENNSKDYRDD